MFETGKYPFRAPKKYPNQDLHGRVRLLNIYYKDFKRFQRFYVELFGWDMFGLPPAAGGKEPGGDDPSVIIATGPSYETWEGVVPGHMNMMAFKAPESELPPVIPNLETHMDRPLRLTVEDVIAHQGELIGDMPEEVQGWVANCSVKDPSGNVLALGKCPDSRTWDEAEAGWDRD